MMFHILKKKSKQNSLENNFLGRENQERFDEIKIAGIRARKIWLTCGSEDVRPYHLAYERLGWVEADYEYEPGLKFPGDPCCGKRGQIDGCRCRIIWDTDPVRISEKPVVSKTEIVLVSDNEVIE